jgi:hypothetical protein
VAEQRQEALAHAGERLDALLPGLALLTDLHSMPTWPGDEWADGLLDGVMPADAEDGGDEEAA